MRRRIEGNLWINSSSTLVYEKQVVEVRSAKVPVHYHLVTLETVLIVTRVTIITMVTISML